MRSNHSTWDPRRPNLYEELKPPPVPAHGNHYGHSHMVNECAYRHPGGFQSSPIFCFLLFFIHLFKFISFNFHFTFY